ncbi:MAG: hypothetical protein IJ272_01500 [Clostridia bacterium]|nr:hypothetical protein [Clostridia bacterium]
MSKTIFGLTKEEVSRQCGLQHAVDPEHKMSPINSNDSFLDACISGGQKILQDPQKREMFYRIYRGKKQ